MTTTCDRCSRITTTQPSANGLLHLCAACQPGEPCGVGTHEWRGSRAPGVWVCYRCPATLQSESIRTDRVAAPSGDADVW